MVFILCSFSLAGCNQLIDKKKAAEQVLAIDPTFEKILQNKKDIDEEITQLRDQIRKQRQIYESKVAVIREEFNSQRASSTSEIERLKRQLDPYRQQTDSQINSVKLQLKQKLRAHKNINSMSKQATKLLEGKKAVELSSTERKEWERRLYNLSTQKKDLNQEILQLKDRLRTLQLKKRLLAQ